MKLKDKNILLAVTGGIAAYKSPNICSMLKKQGANCKVIMTENSTKFIAPLSFMSITGNHVYTAEFHTDYKEPIIEHIELAKWADIIVIAPATANVIAKYANGIGDDLLTSTLLAARSPIMFVPAMNTYMLRSPATQRNIKTVREYGAIVTETATGNLACNDVGEGKMLEPEEIVDEIDTVLREKDLKNMSILVTAGPTREHIDPVRFITNHSSGKMGYAIATEASKRGAKVTLVSGPTNLDRPKVNKFIPIETTLDMKEAVDNEFPQVDVIIKAAAPGDFRPSEYSEEKKKKSSGDMNSIKMVQNPDILKGLKDNKSDQLLIGFAAESHDEIKYGKKKLKEKDLDMIVVNNIVKTGFQSDDNQVTLIYKNEDTEELPYMDKHTLASLILDKIKDLK